MKKIVTIIALVATMQTLFAGNGGRFGMGITQNADAPAAKNFSEKADYLAFMRDGKGFPMAAGTLYPGLTQAMYNKYLPIMQKAHNAAFRAQLTEINRLTNGQLARDFGFTSSIFTDSMCQIVFMSDAVVPMAVPQNEEVTWDAYDVNDMEPFAITRGFHKIGSSKVAEMGWGLNVTGYETILIKSQYCNNNAGTDWIKKHLVATTLSSDEGQGNIIILAGPINQTGGTCLNGGPTNQTGGTCTTNIGGPQNVSTIGSQDGPQNISNVNGSKGPSNISNVGQNGPSNQSSVKTAGTNSAPKKAENGPAAADYQF